jgi:hypothetical protein
MHLDHGDLGTARVGILVKRDEETLSMNSPPFASSRRWAHPAESMPGPAPTSADG